MCKTVISAGIFFIYFKILIFWAVREEGGEGWGKGGGRVKGQKIAQNEK